jgi:beta-glucanase (GH16 family)
MQRNIVVRLAVLMTILATVGAVVLTQQQAKAAGWVEIFSDDFNSFDSNKWYIQDAASNINSELQYYAPDEVYTENGNLILRSRQRSYGGRNYTSGEVLTRDKFSFLYGRVEVRAKLPYGQGIWPAIWTLKPECDGVNGCPVWPPEIDIMESIGDPTRVYQTLHTGTSYRARWPNNTSRGFDSAVSDGEYHVYEVVWDPYYIQFYIDGQPSGRIEASEYFIPDEPLSLILNTAVGGQWPGNPDSSTVFPQYFAIDYVKVYQWQQ